MSANAMARPRLKRSFRWEVSHPEGVFLLSETEQAILRGEVFAALIPLLDGTRTVESLLADLGERHPLPRVFAALDDLRGRGWLAGGPGDGPDDEVAFLDLVG